MDTFGCPRKLKGQPVRPLLNINSTAYRLEHRAPPSHSSPQSSTVIRSHPPSTPPSALHCHCRCRRPPCHHIWLSYCQTRPAKVLSKFEKAGPNNLQQSIRSAVINREAGPIFAVACRGYYERRPKKRDASSFFPLLTGSTTCQCPISFGFWRPPVLPKINHLCHSPPIQMCSQSHKPPQTLPNQSSYCK